MYDFFRGTVAHVDPPSVVLEVGGVGYRLAVPQTSHATFSEGGEITLFAHLYVREDQLSLYGFTSRAERSVFVRLISVNGVGPQIGLQILSMFNPEEFQEAILREDFARISRVKGIGPKLARRIVLELKGLVSELFGSTEPKVTTEALPPSHEQALAALQKLGYARKEALSALEQAAAEHDQELPTEELVRAALRVL